MSVFTSVANMFRPTQQVTVAPVQQQQQQQQVAPMAQANPGATAVVPAAGTSNPVPGDGGTGGADANPLDAFSGIWKTDPTKQPEADPFAAPLLNTDPQQIREAAGKMNFLNGIPQNVMEAAMSGSDPKAFMQVINAAVQNGIAAATQITSATVERATQQNNQRILQTLPGKIKNVQLEQLPTENPVLQHPSAQPMLKMVRQQLQQSEPDLTPAEINRRAEQYLTQFSQQLMQNTPEATQQRQQQQQQQRSAETDWESWAGIQQ